VTRHRSGLTRGFLAMSVACALVPAGLAAASSGQTAVHKKKPVCNLVKPNAQNTDAAKGVGASGGKTSPSSLDPSMQVTSADVATKGKLLTWVIRVKKLTSTYSNQAPLGRGYQFKFVVNGVVINMDAQESPFGQQATGTLPHSKATFDTVRESVPLGDIANEAGVTIRNGQTVLSNLEVFTDYSTNVPGVASGAYYMPNGTAEHVGPVPTTYLAGTPSCVKVGS
jgi:hypothetical protein